MNRAILKKLIFNAKIQPRISRLAIINSKARILGKVFISDNVYIGQSEIVSNSEHTISIGRDTVIRDLVFIIASGNKLRLSEHKIDKVRDIYIGNEVFISSEVLIEGPTLISDGVFIGKNTQIINSRIGNNCVIENEVLIKDVVIPSNTFIPKNSVVDSNEKLKSLILKGSVGDYCEYSSSSKEAWVNAS